jgi:hypothetical protein
VKSMYILILNDGNEIKNAEIPGEQELTKRSTKRATHANKNINTHSNQTHCSTLNPPIHQSLV